MDTNNIEQVKADVEGIKEQIDFLGLFADMYTNTKAHNEWLKTVIKWMAFSIAALIIFIFIDKQIERWDRAQWDYVSTYEATGVYALIDSSGNVIASDLTPEQVEEIARALAEAQQNENGGGV